ncbi:MAG: DUF5060 domain-containing protein [bacterium]|nr:DUF5060 domain-containing protein [bacterium]
MRAPVFCRCLLLLLLLANGLAALPAIEAIQASSDTVHRFQKFELTAGIRAAFENAYDFDEVSVYVAFSAPSGTTSRVDGFHVDDTTGAGVWVVRFAPTEPGLWRYALSSRDSSGTATATPGSFTCIVGDDPGFLRTTPNAYLRFDDGTQYFAIGENIGWGAFTDPVADYRRWLDDLSDHRGNYMRTWMASWGFALEWQDTGLGRYAEREYRAQQLDQVVELASERGIYIQLVLNNHGQVSTRVNPEWQNNPYNVANGGPCQNTWDFFTDATARDLFKRRLRYIVARWGYAPNILAWELFNEVDLTDDYPQHAGDIARWHQEMAAELVRLDINRHLVTTSFSGDAASGGIESADSIWRLADLDLTQTHYYGLDTDALRVQRDLVQEQRQAFGKPAMIGEFCFTDAATARSSDPDGIYLHNSLWASAFSGAMGAAAIWWWDSYIEPLDLYFHFEPLALFFAALDLPAEDFRARVVRAGSAAAEDLEARPGIGLRRASVAAFEVSPGGVITPSPVQAGRYLFGAEDVDRRNPPTFFVDYAQPGEFHLDTGSVLEGAPRLTVWLDGRRVFDVDAVADGHFVVPVPLGPHAIRVENSGSGYVRITSYNFADYVPTVLSFALQGQQTIAGWLQNKKYNWRDVLAAGPPPIVEQAVVRIDDLALHGDYRVEWLDPLNGEQLQSNTVASTEGSLTLETPPFSWDLAYRIRYLGAATAVTDLDASADAGPEAFALSQNFPNPFNSSTVIGYQLPQPMIVDLHIHDLLGQRVATLVQGLQPSGSAQVIWQGVDDRQVPVSSGSYFYVLSAGTYSARGRMTLLR